MSIQKNIKNDNCRLFINRKVNFLQFLMAFDIRYTIIFLHFRTLVFYKQRYVYCYLTYINFKLNY